MVIETTKGELILLDDEDWPVVKGLNWYAEKGHRDILYARACLPRIKGGKQPKVSMHRLIMGARDSKIQIDHRNGNGLDNRRVNLRLCTHDQNNFARHRNCSSTGYKGVSRDHNGKFRARVQHNGVVMNYGSYATAQEAALAYNVAALELFGSFAVLNQVG